MRCVACNNILSETEYRKEKAPGLEEDLCNYCRFISRNPNYCSTHEHQFEHITEIAISIPERNNQ